MSDKNTIARPYAKAAFSFAVDAGALSQWSQALMLAASVSQDGEFSRLLNNPHVSSAQLAGLVLEVGQSVFNKEQENFIQLLAQNGRLNVLDSVSALFETYRAEHEKTLEVEVLSAVALNEAQQASITSALKKRLAREIHIKSTIKPNLIGGLVVRAGDLVIDGSVKGQLETLSQQLVNNE